MFGVSFSELGLIFAVALIVLGPARLPGLVRKIGRWVGKARSMAREFQQQLENEISLEELNRLTDARTKEAQADKEVAAAQDPANQAEPAAESGSGTDTGSGELAGGGYPYGPQEPAAPSPQPDDDTYSHAHAEGASPMSEEPAEQPPEEKKTDGGPA